ncbi:minor capsid protein [Lacrimispora sp. 210928-DFI.3.58]|uniref:minor capsid protein n=1 Tax=Lacrimispora sp. 210928-DFI.3.58 TaxID=2883214 RepID=UPI001D068DAC|nr:minor capsid protein [Lacrimispora sp. 210928-DFI.3.58]MCB7320779.1 minor capsid protein [Lacrimispora sp. 210928-DFI.3.58]
MLTLKDIRQYISGLEIAADCNVYIGKLDNKKQKSIGVYNRKTDGPVQIALGGLGRTSYGTRPISLLVHWNKSVSETEEAAYELYEKLLNESSLMIGDTEVRFLILQVPQPVDVGTDDDGVYEYVIWLDFIYQRK